MTKSSAAARRKRRLEHKPKPGRPPGTFASLFKDPQRFSVATWLLLEPMLGPHRAACSAIILIEEITPIEIGTIDGLISTASADYMPPRGTYSDLDDRARDLAAKAKLVASRATERELAWLAVSAEALRGLVAFVVMGDAVGTDQSLMILRHADWGEIIARVGRRLGIALREEAIQPFSESRLRVAGRRLLEAMRAKSAAKT
jgi:hypothetical protein